MKTYAALFLALLMLCAACTAFACGTYVLVRDSDTRLLFEDEVYGYHVDTLGYILCEIVARHGYHFDPEGRYDEHFSCLNYVELHDSGFPYKEAPADVTNEEIVAGLADIERQNIDLILRVMAEKISTNDCSGYWESWTCSESEEWNYFSDFDHGRSLDLPRNLIIPVYSGPGRHYLRGDNGCASVNTNKVVFGYGFDGDWLMIAYFEDSEIGQVRVGYIHQDDFGRDLNPAACRAADAPDDDLPKQECRDHELILGQLEFGSEKLVLPVGVTLTDDPMNTGKPLARLSAGETVTVLFTYPPERTKDDFENEDDYEDYKELYEYVFDGVPLIYVEHGGETPVRGFITSQLMTRWPELYVISGSNPPKFGAISDSALHEWTYGDPVKAEQFVAENLAKAEQLLADHLAAEPPAEDTAAHALWEAVSASYDTFIRRIRYIIENGK